MHPDNKVGDTKGWIEYLRLITPLAIFVLTIYVNMINANINELKQSVIEMRAQLFHHLTNADLHTPREAIITKGEFAVYQKMRDVQIDDLKECQRDVIAILNDIRKYVRQK